MMLSFLHWQEDSLGLMILRTKPPLASSYQKITKSELRCKFWRHRCVRTLLDWEESYQAEMHQQLFQAFMLISTSGSVSLIPVLENW